MSANSFFGYGSLVNEATHHRPLNAKPFTLSGWRRQWGYRVVSQSGLQAVSLTVRPDASCQIDGLLVEVAGEDWPTLDERERGYDRIALDKADARTFIYVAQPKNRGRATAGHKILQSYVDAVCQGYLQVFGVEGLSRFIETTEGWDGDFLADRDNPLYPRPVTLSGEERELIDAAVSLARRNQATD